MLLLLVWAAAREVKREGAAKAATAKVVAVKSAILMLIRVSECAKAGTEKIGVDGRFYGPCQTALLGW